MAVDAHRPRGELRRRLIRHRNLATDNRSVLSGAEVLRRAGYAQGRQYDARVVDPVERAASQPTPARQHQEGQVR